MTCSRSLKRKLNTGIALGPSHPRMAQSNKRPKHAQQHAPLNDAQQEGQETQDARCGSSSNSFSQQHAGSSSNSTRLVLSYHESHKRKKLSEPGPVTMDMRQHVWHLDKRDDGST